MTEAAGPSPGVGLLGSQMPRLFLRASVSRARSLSLTMVQFHNLTF